VIERLAGFDENAKLPGSSATLVLAAKHSREDLLIKLLLQALFHVLRQRRLLLPQGFPQVHPLALLSSTSSSHLHFFPQAAFPHGLLSSRGDDELGAGQIELLLLSRPVTHLSPCPSNSSQSVLSVTFLPAQGCVNAMSNELKEPVAFHLPEAALSSVLAARKALTRYI
jgi:hypothetical protein